MKRTTLCCRAKGKLRCNETKGYSKEAYYSDGRGRYGTGESFDYFLNMMTMTVRKFSQVWTVYGLMWFLRKA